MTKKEIGALISNQLKEKKISYYAVEMGANMQTKQIKAIESGESGYSIDTLLKVLDFLGLEFKIPEKK